METNTVALASCEAVSLRERALPRTTSSSETTGSGNYSHRQATILHPFAGINKQGAKADWISG